MFGAGAVSGVDGDPGHGDLVGGDGGGEQRGIVQLGGVDHRGDGELATLDPGAPLTDLEPLREMMRDASIVGVARGTHGARELSALTHRTLRFLVEHLGFRSLAIEEDWTTGIEVDEYLRTGRGDLRALLADAEPWWRTEEFLAVLRWMRSYNEQHSADLLRFVGLDNIRLPPYGAVAGYERQAAPHRLPEPAAHFAALHSDVRVAGPAAGPRRSTVRRGVATGRHGLDLTFT